MHFKRYFGDAHSITSYRDAMSRLQKVGDHEQDHQPPEPPPHVRLVTNKRAARTKAAPSSTTAQLSGTISRIRGQAAWGGEPAPTRSSLSLHSAPRPSEPGAHPDLAHPVELSVVGEPAGAADQRTDQGADQRPRVRTIVGALGLTALVGGSTALLLLDLHQGGAAPHRPALSAPPASTAGAPPSTPAAAGATTPGSATPGSAAAGSAPAGRTGANRPIVTPTSIGPTTAAYSVAGTHLDVAITANAPCWIEVRTAPSGATVFTGTLVAGQQRAFSEVGSLWMRIGFPAGVSVVADGTALTLPTGSNPYDLSFTQTNQTNQTPTGH